MPEENKLSVEELKERWTEREDGIKFRTEIIRQLQSEETGHAVDWDNLAVPVDGDEKRWRDFPGVKELNEGLSLEEILFELESIKYNLNSVAEGNLSPSDQRGIDLKDEEIPWAEASWRMGDLRGIGLKDVEIPGAKLSFARLENANLYGARLENADLREAWLKNANLYAVRLENANLREAWLENANLYGARLENANLFGAQLENADLSGARLENAYMFCARLENAKLYGARLDNADLRATRLKNADLREAHLNGADMNGTTVRLKSFRRRSGLIGLVKNMSGEEPLEFEKNSLIKEIRIKIARFEPFWRRSGIIWMMKNLLRLDPEKHRATELMGADIRNAKLYSDPVLFRQLLDEQYLDVFAEKRPFWYVVWLWTSSCGRSPLTVGFWSLVIGLFFGAVFGYYPFPDYAWLKWLKGVLVIDSPMFNFSDSEWWRPYYHSFTTLTTLGGAGAEPLTATGFWWHTLENVIGYVMLGYLIAVMGDLLTRRSG